jgi:hypothetical protein
VLCRVWQVMMLSKHMLLCHSSVGTVLECHMYCMERQGGTCRTGRQVCMKLWYEQQCTRTTSDRWSWSMESAWIGLD